MKIHFAPDTRAVRVAWLCEELGLAYELERYALGDPKMRDPDYLKVHPLGRVPAIEDDGVTMHESGAIVEYILAKYGDGRLVPDVASPEFGPYLQWLHYAEGMIMPQINILVVETIILSEERRNQVNIDRAMKLLNKMLAVVDRHMEGREFLAGDFSGADIMTGHACSVAAKLGADISDKPHAAAYIARIDTRPALQKARAL